MAAVHVLGIVGSLRAASYNRWLLEAARGNAPESMTIDVAELGGIPLYNADLDTDARRPPAVEQLKARIASADALLIATPEYNHTVPGVLQNAIDWASRPAFASPLTGKPIATMGASTGIVGTARAQQQLKLVLMSARALVMPYPGLLVGMAAEKFDATGALVHDATRQSMATLLAELERWTRRVTP
jgi:chromate reductase